MVMATGTGEISLNTVSAKGIAYKLEELAGKREELLSAVSPLTEKAVELKEEVKDWLFRARKASYLAAQIDEYNEDSIAQFNALREIAMDHSDRATKVREALLESTESIRKHVNAIDMLSLTVHSLGAAQNMQKTLESIGLPSNGKLEEDIRTLEYSVKGLLELGNNPSMVNALEVPMSKRPEPKALKEANPAETVNRFYEAMESKAQAKIKEMKAELESVTKPAHAEDLTPISDAMTATVRANRQAGETGKPEGFVQDYDPTQIFSDEPKISLAEVKAESERIKISSPNWVNMPKKPDGNCQKEKLDWRIRQNEMDSIERFAEANRQARKRLDSKRFEGPDADEQREQHEFHLREMERVEIDAKKNHLRKYGVENV